MKRPCVTSTTNNSNIKTTFRNKPINLRRISHLNHFFSSLRLLFCYFFFAGLVYNGYVRFNSKTTATHSNQAQHNRSYSRRVQILIVSRICVSVSVSVTLNISIANVCKHEKRDLINMNLILRSK